MLSYYFGRHLTITVTVSHYNGLQEIDCQVTQNVLFSNYVIIIGTA